jgi:hypothetical protein
VDDIDAIGRPGVERQRADGIAQRGKCRIAAHVVGMQDACGGAPSRAERRASAARSARRSRCRSQGRSRRYPLVEERWKVTRSGHACSARFPRRRFTASAMRAATGVKCRGRALRVSAPTSG